MVMSCTRFWSRHCKVMTRFLLRIEPSINFTKLWTKILTPNPNVIYCKELNVFFCRGWVETQFLKLNEWNVKIKKICKTLQGVDPQRQENFLLVLRDFQHVRVYFFELILERFFNNTLLILFLFQAHIIEIVRREPWKNVIRFSLVFILAVNSIIYFFLEKIFNTFNFIFLTISVPCLRL